MKIYDIKKPDNTTVCTFIDRLLENKMTNEPLFDDTYFTVCINITDIREDYVNYLYRLLWEKLYIHQKSKSTVVDGVLTLKLSVSDAIGFIHFATPPLLKNLIPDSIKSLDSIYDVLKQFLLEGNGNRGKDQEYIGYFRQFAKLLKFDTVWTHDDTKIYLIRTTNTKNLICVLDEYTCSFEDAFHNNMSIATEEVIIQSTIDCVDENQIKYVSEKIMSADGIDIVNINCGYDGDVSITTLYHSTPSNMRVFPSTLNQVIRSTYEPFMKK